MRKLPLHWGRWLRQCYWLMIRLTNSFPSLPAADIILTSPAQTSPNGKRQSAGHDAPLCSLYLCRNDRSHHKLTSAMATTEEYAQQNKYAHSLFVADYAVTHTVSWDALNTAGLIFGKIMPAAAWTTPCGRRRQGVSLIIMAKRR